MNENMRTIDVREITERIRLAVIEANLELPADVEAALKAALIKENQPRAQKILGILIENAAIARQDRMPLCQDTGIVNIVMELGQEVSLTGGDLQEAINEGVRLGYREAYLRKSVLNCPLARVNTTDNTPALIETEIVPGDGLRMWVMPKGAGSENMGRVAMLKPAQGQAGIMDFVLESIAQAGGNPCPPIIVGVGIGGNLAKAAALAKKALLRPLNESHPDPDVARMESELLSAANSLGIGPQGLGGLTTALAVHIETYPTHIAQLPVAVNLGCHCMRRVLIEI